MARSAIDATRFTATGPEAKSKGTGRATTIPLSTPAPQGETPQQRVARLREAHRRANLAKESNFDRVVSVGRVWADRAHRFTTYTLILSSAIGTIIAAAAIGDMVLYNRRKRREWMSQKLDEEARETAAAFQAFKEGTANEDQILLINRERQKVEAAEAKRNSKGIIGRSIAFVTSPLSKEEKPVFGASTEDSEQGAGEGLGIVKAVEEVRSQRQDEHRIPSLTEDHPERSQLGSRGGPLDQLGAEAAAAASETKQSWANRWTSWISGR